MTAAGFHTGDGAGLGLLGLKDAGGYYGVAAAENGLNSRAAGAAATHQAMAAANCPGDKPQIIHGNLMASVAVFER